MLDICKHEIDWYNKVLDCLFEAKRCGIAQEEEYKRDLVKERGRADSAEARVRELEQTLLRILAIDISTHKLQGPGHKQSPK